MKTRIITRHCEISQSLRDRTHEVLDKLDRFDPRVTAVDVTFDEQKRLRRIDALVKIRGDDHVVPCALQVEGHHLANAWLVVYDQDRLSGYVFIHHGPSIL